MNQNTFGDQQPPPDSEEAPTMLNREFLALLLGMTLTTLGVGGALVTFISAYRVLTSGGSEFIQQLAIPTSMSIAVPQVGNITLPTSTLSLVGYGIIVGLLMVLSTVSGVLLKSGITLLKPDTRELAQELISQIRKMN